MYPNKFTKEVKTGWINNELNMLYREAALQNVYSFTTTEGQANYELPTYIEVQNIISNIYITQSDTEIDEDTNFNEYKYVDSYDRYLAGNKYYRADYSGLNNIGIYPVPDTDDLIGMFIYRKRPEKLSSHVLTAQPDIKADWVDILKYKCIMMAALSGNDRDTETYNIYARLYNGLLVEIMQSRYERNQSYPRTKDVMKRGSHRRAKDTDLRSSLYNTLERL
jgi:hypothetical protein